MSLRNFLNKFAYLAVGAISIAAFAGADDYYNYNDGCSHVCTSTACCGKPCNEPPVCDWGYNPPAYCTCGCDTVCDSLFDNVSVRVDFLWWRANEEGLQLGVEENVALFAPSTVNNSVFNETRTKKPNFKYDAGFRLGLINHCACDCYDIALNWTHYHTKANVRGATPSTSNTATNSTTFYSDWERVVGANPISAKGRYTLNMDLVDLELGRKFYVSNCFVLRPNIGLRGVRIDQNYRVKSSADKNPGDTFDASLQNFLTEVKSRCNQLAVGPRMGLDIEVHMGCGFVLFGKAAGSIVFGKFDNHSSEHLVDFVIPDEGAQISDFNYVAKSSAFRTSRTNTDLAIGLKWERCFDWCNRSHPVSLEFAWEHHAFYDMNNFNFSPRGIVEGQGTAIPNGTHITKHGDLFTQGLTFSFVFGF